MLSPRKYGKYSFYEQYSRTIRYYNKFIKITQKRLPYPFSDNELDVIHSFFINAYHLKDWIINDPIAGVSKAMVNNYINTHENLSVCADICNGLKHFSLIKPHFDKDTKLGSLVHATINNGRQSREERRIIVEKLNKPSDGVYLAMNCIALWEDFIQRNVKPL